MWLEAFAAKYDYQGPHFTKSDWDQLLGHCQAATDTPCVIFYRELLAAYPDAKVILTVRDDVDQWFDSMMKTIMPFFEQICLPPRTLLGKLKRKWFSPIDTKTYEFCETFFRCSPMFNALWADYQNGTQTAKQWYLDYNAEIQRIVPAAQLFVFNVKEGWTPLCEFLDHEVPDRPFPRRNDVVTFERNTQAFGAFIEQTTSTQVRGAMLAAGWVIVAAAAAAAGWFWRNSKGVKWTLAMR
jgi:hypothetical protein